MEWFRAMRLFASVVQHGSLSSAARQAGLSAASVSRQIGALETALGCRLVNRTSRVLTLTEAGETYLRHVELVLQRVAEANASVAELQSVPRGTLRVHSRMLVGQQYLVPALPTFLARYPETSVDLLLSNDVVNLVERNIDVDIRIGKLEDSALMFRKLTTSERLVCAAPAYIERADPIAAPADLARHNCLTYNLDPRRTVWRFIDEAQRMLEVQVNGNLRSDNGPALLEATRAGLGVALMPDWSIRDDLATGRLVRLFPRHRVSYTEFDNGVYAVYQRSRHMTAKMRVFIAFMEELFRRRPAPAAAVARAVSDP
jgi:DNA-binding transcriptional LysR family regulator